MNIFEATGRVVRFCLLIFISLFIISEISNFYYKNRTVNPDIPTMDKAVYDAALEIIDSSIAKNQEWGFIIYQNRWTGEITIGETQKGDSDRMGLNFNEMIVLVKEPVGFFHTHGAERKGLDGENFSHVDTAGSNLFNYLMTPRKKFIRRNPNNNETMFLNHNLKWEHHGRAMILTDECQVLLSEKDKIKNFVCNDLSQNKIRNRLPLKGK